MRTVIVLGIALAAAGCEEKKPERPIIPEGHLREKAKEDLRRIQEEHAGEPKHIQVQHVLIAFKGAKDAKPEVTRSQEEARLLALDLVERLKGGQDMDWMVKQYSSDSGAGTYAMANEGEPFGKGETRRKSMVKAFGDVSFHLGVGEVGLTEYDSYASPYGYHVIKRLK